MDGCAARARARGARSPLSVEIRLFPRDEQQVASKRRSYRWPSRKPRVETQTEQCGASSSGARRINAQNAIATRRKRANLLKRSAERESSAPRSATCPCKRRPVSKNSARAHAHTTNGAPAAAAPIDETCLDVQGYKRRRRRRQMRQRNQPRRWPRRPTRRRRQSASRWALPVFVAAQSELTTERKRIHSYWAH